MFTRVSLSLKDFNIQRSHQYTNHRSPGDKAQGARSAKKREGEEERGRVVVRPVEVMGDGYQLESTALAVPYAKSERQRPSLVPDDCSATLVKCRRAMRGEKDGCPSSGPAVSEKII